MHRAKCYYASCQMFTLWYTQKKPNKLYGFDSQYKLKCKTFSPMDGVDIYPYFDEYDDLLALSFEYKRKVTDTEHTFFETYTADHHYKWDLSSDDESPDGIWWMIMRFLSTRFQPFLVPAQAMLGRIETYP